MFIEVVTTITTKIDVETFETEHSVEIVADDSPTESIALAAALGGCRSAVKTLEEKV